MGIRQFGHVKFDGVDLADFGVTLSGTGTYNAPERDVTSISVPGRNGDILIDNGRYFNIEVEYPVNIELGLPDKVPALRAFLMSHKGYFRLEDSYHPDEFRLAQFAGPFEINPTGSHNRYGRMVLTFNCKPQRFLKAGERPALTLEGTSSSSTFVTMGVVEDICSAAFKTALPYYFQFKNEHITVIDMTNFTSNSYVLRLYYNKDRVGDAMWFCDGDDPTSGSFSTGTAYKAPIAKQEMIFGKSPSPCDYNYTISSAHPYMMFSTPDRWEITNWDSATITVYDEYYPDKDDINNPTLFDASPLLHIKLPNSHIMTDKAVALVNGSEIRCTFASNSITIGAYSQTVEDLYIDCGTMSAYTKLTGTGTEYSLNMNVSLPAKNIILKPGKNDIYTNDAIDSIEIIPNWWRL